MDILVKGKNILSENLIEKIKIFDVRYTSYLVCYILFDIAKFVKYIYRCVTSDN